MHIILQPTSGQEKTTEDVATDKGSAEQQEDAAQAETEEQQQVTDDQQVTPTDPEPEPQPEAEPEPETQPESQPEPEQTTTSSEEEPKPDVATAVPEEKPEVEEAVKDKKVSETEVAELPKDSPVDTEVVVDVKPDTVEETEAVNKEEEVKEKPKASAVLRNKVRSADPREGVDMAIGESGITKTDPITVGKMFRDTVSKCPEHVALRFKDVEAGVWKEYTYTQYYQLCVQAAKSFLKVKSTIFMYNKCICIVCEHAS